MSEKLPQAPKTEHKPPCGGGRKQPKETLVGWLCTRDTRTIYRHSAKHLEEWTTCMRVVGGLPRKILKEPTAWSLSRHLLFYVGIYGISSKSKLKGIDGAHFNCWKPVIRGLANRLAIDKPELRHRQTLWKLRKGHLKGHFKGHWLRRTTNSLSE